ncbi:MAG: site-2 protease family protein [Terracidiphilus sp.]
MHAFLVSVVAFIVLVGIMVVVHEAGHFIVAKLCGVRVEAFSIGFGPRLFGFTWGETEYKVCLLPFGGFVKMTGESPEQNLDVPGSVPGTPVIVQAYEKLPGQSPENVPPHYGGIDDPGSFLAHPRWQRMLIGLAGPIANFILAWVLMGLFLTRLPPRLVFSPVTRFCATTFSRSRTGVRSMRSRGSTPIRSFPLPSSAATRLWC